MLASSSESVAAVPVMPHSFGKLRNSAWYVTWAMTWLCLDTVMPAKYKNAAFCKKFRGKKEEKKNVKLKNIKMPTK